MNCGTESVKKNKDGRLHCLVCKNSGGTGAIMHKNSDGTPKRGPYGFPMPMWTYMNDGVFCDYDPCTELQEVKLIMMNSWVERETPSEMILSKIDFYYEFKGKKCLSWNYTVKN